VLDDLVDWNEVAGLLTEGYRVCAPPKRERELGR
jgi:hypothetical protein